jgi:hypothetical protein
MYCLLNYTDRPKGARGRVQAVILACEAGIAGTREPVGRAQLSRFQRLPRLS